MPTTPKHPRARRNRKPLRGPDWIPLPAEPYRGPKPRMPRGLSENAKRAWQAWWSSPMAHQWAEADWYLVEQAVQLVDKLSEQWSKSASSELANVGDRLGLSPDGRRRLRWMMPDAEIGEDGVPTEDPDADLVAREARRARKERVVALDRKLTDNPNHSSSSYFDDDEEIIG